MRKIKRILKILLWRHSGFSVHSRVRALTKREAERVGKYMIRPLLSLEHLSFLEKEAKVITSMGKRARKRSGQDYQSSRANIRGG